MVNPVQWFTHLWNKQGEQVLKVGSRIQTKHGWGTVTGACIVVHHDNSIPGKHPNDKNWQFNAGKEFV